MTGPASARKSSECCAHSVCAAQRSCSPSRARDGKPRAVSVLETPPKDHPGVRGCGGTPGSSGARAVGRECLLACLHLRKKLKSGFSQAVNRARRALVHGT